MYHWMVIWIWRAAEKIVYSKTLQSVSSSRTRIERVFDPDEIRRLKESLETDITISGAELIRVSENYHISIQRVLIYYLETWKNQ